MLALVAKACLWQVSGLLWAWVPLLVSRVAWVVLAWRVAVVCLKSFAVSVPVRFALAEIDCVSLLVGELAACCWPAHHHLHPCPKMLLGHPSLQQHLLAP